jgi:hypothetical protein
LRGANNRGKFIRRLARRPGVFDPLDRAGDENRENPRRNFMQVG